jgi:hypothetical protein
MEDFAVTCPLVPGVPHLVSGSCASPRIFGWGSLQTPPREDALALFLAFGCANTWREDFHLASSVPCPAHTTRNRVAYGNSIPLHAGAEGCGGGKRSVRGGGVSTLDGTSTSQPSGSTRPPPRAARRRVAVSSAARARRSYHGVCSGVSANHVHGFGRLMLQSDRGAVMRRFFPRGRPKRERSAGWCRRQRRAG